MAPGRFSVVARRPFGDTGVGLRPVARRVAPRRLGCCYHRAGAGPAVCPVGCVAMSSPGPVVWMVPRRPDPHFVGREQELADLEAALAAGGASALTQPASAHGLGGVGK